MLTCSRMTNPLVLEEDKGWMKHTSWNDLYVQIKSKARRPFSSRQPPNTLEKNDVWNTTGWAHSHRAYLLSQNHRWGQQREHNWGKDTPMPHRLMWIIILQFFLIGNYRQSKLVGSNFNHHTSSDSPHFSHIVEKIFSFPQTESIYICVSEN